jgi:hypothetical protein
MLRKSKHAAHGLFSALRKSERIALEGIEKPDSSGGRHRPGRGPQRRRSDPTRSREARGSPPFRNRNDRERQRQVTVPEFITLAEAIGRDPIELLRAIMKRRDA